jgi:hypothetical protein
MYIIVTGLFFTFGFFSVFGEMQNEFYYYKEKVDALVVKIVVTITNISLPRC